MFPTLQMLMEYHGDSGHDRDEPDLSFISRDHEIEDGPLVASVDIAVQYAVNDDDDYTDHPYGSTTAREYHPAEVEIISAVANEEVVYADEDGNSVKRFPKGTDVADLPGWSTVNDESIQEQAEEHFAKHHS